jgi:hypothetical protein
MDYKEKYESLLSEFEKLSSSSINKNENHLEAEESGRAQYRRLKEKGKIKGGKNNE